MPDTDTSRSRDIYPDTRAERNRWIESLRPPRLKPDPSKPVAFIAETERAANGAIASVATLFLANRECPWKCLMCDLWKHTLTETVAPEAIPAQIDHALAALQPEGPFHQVKLYNSGSFFDPGAIPPQSHDEIIRRLEPFDRLVVECHPLLVQERVLAFRDRLQAQSGCRLEVAMGLETAHPEVLVRLNKGMTLDDFHAAARFLADHHIDLRVFLLVHPPFLKGVEATTWLQRSIDAAQEAGATVTSLIPIRADNGAMERLAAAGQLETPTLAMLEEGLAYGIARKRTRVFADLWDLERFSRCPTCFAQRIARLDLMNRDQVIIEPHHCVDCGQGGGRSD